MRALFCSSLIAVSLLVSVAQAATYIASGAFDSSKLSDSASWETGTLPNVTIDGNNVSFNGDGLLFTQSTINWTLNGTWTFQYLTFNNAAIEGGITPHTTLHLGANGRIVVDNVLNFSQAAKNPDSTFALHATLTSNSGTWYERNLISANSMWNIEAFQTGALSDHFYFDGYVLSDQILAPGYNVNDLEEGFAYIRCLWQTCIHFRRVQRKHSRTDNGGIGPSGTCRSTLATPSHLRINTVFYTRRSVNHGTSFLLSSEFSHHP